MSHILKNFVLILCAVIFLVSCDDSSQSSTTENAVTPDSSSNILPDTPVGPAVTPLSNKTSKLPQEIQQLLSEARKGDTKAQFELGLAYYEGTKVTRDYIESYIWLSFAGLQGHEVASFAAADVEGILKKLNLISLARKKANLYYLFYVKEKNTVEIPDGFVFTVNDIRYQYAAAISPDFPIMVKAEHLDPSVITIRLQNVDNPAKTLSFPVDQKQNIKNIEKNMSQGNTIAYEFIALDKEGTNKGSVTIYFIPK